MYAFEERGEGLRERPVEMPPGLFKCAVLGERDGLWKSPPPAPRPEVYGDEDLCCLEFSHGSRSFDPPPLGNGDLDR